MTLVDLLILARKYTDHFTFSALKNDECVKREGNEAFANKNLTRLRKNYRKHFKQIVFSDKIASSGIFLSYHSKYFCHSLNFYCMILFN